ncbi:SDR family oxidoreductase [Burkholderia sp. Ac-20344]|uniref:SDR family NAD(P)-dependent oxidoreductase n=1 Tax=Burkholderia sp. Ac-20344 TaxID=2703890 RepID=UPI00197CAA43|nr:SDR family oxidoreductase [Burkholderia sp. Ac-20344]MBN3836731.1 SDR family oxidoreductase [Burkholderia sp. Ac-20344]
MKSFDGQVVVVTGAGSGMGQAMLDEFTSRGAFVAALGSRESRLKTAIDSIANPTLAAAFEVDVGVPESVAAGVEQIVKRWGRVDVLCNNAGILGGHEEAHEAGLDEWDRVLAVNLTGPYLMARAILPVMLTQGKGVILNTASTSGFSAAGGGAAYTASKHGLIGLSRQLTFEYGARGIRVNTICPGAVATPMAIPEHADASFPDVDAAVKKTPAGRFGKPEEIAKLAAFLAGEDADFIHGSDYVIDGGWLAAARDPY